VYSLVDPMHFYPFLFSMKHDALSTHRTDAPDRQWTDGQSEKRTRLFVHLCLTSSYMEFDTNIDLYFAGCGKIIYH